MHRFFADENGIVNGVAQLEAEDAQHAGRVLRLQIGDHVTLFCAGEAYAAVIDSFENGVSVRVGEKLKSPEASVRVTLYQGVPKGDKMDYIVQKCTEGGVHRIVPVNMPRCVAKLDGKDDKKRARWQRIAREAAKQSFRPVTPEIAPAVSMKQLPALLKTHQLVLCPWEDEHACSLREALKGEITDIAVIIGPEGGMSEEDVMHFRESGAQAVTLGLRIFRTETAGLAALIAIMTLTGNLE